MEKQKIYFPHGESKQEFSISQPYPSRYIDCFIPVYSRSIKRVKKRGKCKSGRKKENKMFLIQIKVRAKKRNDTFTKREEKIKK